MSGRFGIYTPSPQFGTVKNPFGKDTANLGLFQALARHGGFEELLVISPVPGDPAGLARALLGGREGARIGVGSAHDPRAAIHAGCLLRGKADLAEHAWQRRAVGERAYSLIGLVHTLAPPAIRDYIAAAAHAPVQPWDALICTSPAVQTALAGVFAEYGAYLADRFGGTVRPAPALPLVPLGVDGAALAGQADRPAARDALRARLGLGADDVLVLWLGRLSFFEKAFPQPMFRAVAEAAGLSGRRLHLAMAGWFPNGEVGREIYLEAARAYAPEVPLHLLDGNDAGLVADLWAGADIFLSLVDNVQETFGLTPLEAMAAGLPIVASDWDGYRYTLRDGVEAFLVRTLGGPPGPAGRLMSARHLAGQDAYQSYVGTVAQHTAVDVGQAAAALARLAADPELRARMGRAGRARIASAFDWPVVARQVRALADDLAEARRAGPRYGTQAPGPAHHPVRHDPFAEFAGFATQVLAPGTRIALRPGVDAAAAQGELARSAPLRLDGFAQAWRADREACARVLALLGEGERTVGELQGAVLPQRAEALALAVVWMAKLGIVDWRAE